MPRARGRHARRAVGVHRDPCGYRGRRETGWICLYRRQFSGVLVSSTRDSSYRGKSPLQACPAHATERIPISALGKDADMFSVRGNIGNPIRISETIGIDQRDFGLQRPERPPKESPSSSCIVVAAAALRPRSAHATVHAVAARTHAPRSVCPLGADTYVYRSYRLHWIKSRCIIRGIKCSSKVIDDCP